MEIDGFKAMKRDAQQILQILLEQQEIPVDADPLKKALQQVVIQLTRAQLACATEICLHHLDGRVSARVLKTAMQRQIQVLCELQLDFECNDVLVAAEQVEEYIPLMVKARESIHTMRSACEENVSGSNNVLARLAFRTEGGWSYLHLAAEQGQQESVLHLLRAGAHVDASDNKRRTPLTYAAYVGDLVAIGSLLDFGADISHVDDDGNTPLHMACMAECPSEKVVDRLWRAGADERVLNGHGLTPLEVLKLSSSEKEGFGSVRLLLEKAPARRLWLRCWGWIVIFRNRAGAEVVGDGGSDRVRAQKRSRRSSRLAEGKARLNLEFLVRRAPDGVFLEIISFL